MLLAEYIIFDHVVFGFERSKDGTLQGCMILLLNQLLLDALQHEWKVLDGVVLLLLWFTR